MDFADLEKLVAAGVTLMDEAKVPKGAVITNLIVKGRPAVAVEYTYLRQDNPSRRGSPRLLPVWYWNSAALM